MNISLPVSTKRIVSALFAFLAVLFCFHLYVVVAHLKFHTPVAAMTELFDMDREANLPALFNVLLFMIAGGLFYAMGQTVQGKARRPWTLMAVVFVFLGLDEGAQIHEKLMMVTLRLMNNGGMGDGQMGWLYYAWTIPYGIAAIGLLVLLLPWLVKLDTRVRWGLMLAGFIYVFGAVFMEAFSGKIAEGLEATARPEEQLPWLPCMLYPPTQCFLYDNVSYVVIYTIEELAEMTGVILCIGVLLRALERGKTRIEVAFGKA